jgi:hypothetical protein
MHGIPVLIGGTNSSSAIRTMAEVEQWYTHVMVNTQDISATRKIFHELIRTSNSSGTNSHTNIVRLPVSFAPRDTGIFTCSGFENLLTVAPPISSNMEQHIVLTMIQEINNMFLLELSSTVCFDRRFEAADEVFEDDGRTRVILVGASHLQRLSEHLDCEKWRIVDLTRPGWRITDQSVRDLATDVEDAMMDAEMDNSIMVFHLLDNNVYMVDKPGGEKCLPSKGQDGAYHIDGKLCVAGRDTVKELFCAVLPIIKAGGDCRKIILSPLSRYWVAPCCCGSGHHVNYNDPGYLPGLGDSVYRIRDHLRDLAHLKRIRKYRVFCPNRLIGMGERGDDPSIEELRVVADRWGTDPVHPAADTYRVMAEKLEEEMMRPVSSFSNSVTGTGPAPDMAEHGQYWVESCSAALPRNDSTTARFPPAKRRRWQRGNPTPQGGAGRGRTRGGRGSAGYVSRGHRGSYTPHAAHYSTGSGRPRAYPRSHFSY